MEVLMGRDSDIENWMKLVKAISWNFPGLETKEAINEHKETVLKFMRREQAYCVKNETGEIIGVILFSRKLNMICCLGVSEADRKQGIATALLSEALQNLDRTKEITVTTFCENDIKGKAPRALYKKFGFIEGEYLSEFGYPNQKFILNP